MDRAKLVNTASSLPSELVIPRSDNRKIWVLGSSNIDTTYFVDSLPKPGETVHARSTLTATGGKGANQACAAAHCGADISFVGGMGNDAAAGQLLEALTRRGIDTTYVQTIPGVASGSAIIQVEDSGQNCIVVNAGANAHINSEKLCELPLTKTSFAVAQLETSMEATETFFEHAKQCGACTVLNPSPYTAIGSKLLAHTDILVANEHEIAGLSGLDNGSIQDSLNRVIAKGPQRIVVTLGNEGALYQDESGTGRVPALSVTPVDTQGAGDAFLGVLCAHLSFGNSLKEAVSTANTVAAFSVTRTGSTQLSLPDVALDNGAREIRLIFS